jgi:hypothetical protein
MEVRNYNIHSYLCSGLFSDRFVASDQTELPRHTYLIMNVQTSPICMHHNHHLYKYAMSHVVDLVNEA